MAKFAVILDAWMQELAEASTMKMMLSRQRAGVQWTFVELGFTDSP